MGAKRPEVDWIGVQASYRSGQLSNSEIAKRYGVTEGSIRYRAKLKNGSKTYPLITRPALGRRYYETLTKDCLSLVRRRRLTRKLGTF